VSLHDQNPYRPKVRGRRVHGGDDLSFRRLKGEVRAALSRGRRGQGRARVAVKARGALGRRVVIKAWYVRMDAGVDSVRGAKTFLRYMEKEAAARDGGRSQLYGREESGRDGSSLERELLDSLPSEKHQFRVVISPEDAELLDLTKFTTELMAQVEKDLGQPIIWAAANHYDTDDFHTHVVIRGVDRNGAELRFDRAYISRVWRERAEELATRELGPRTDLERQRQIEREVHQGRLTSLDRGIGRQVREDGTVRLKDLDKHQRERLKVLGDWGLAREVNLLEWKLREGWQQTLREDGERGDKIKQMHKAMRLDASRYRIVDRAGALPRDPRNGESEITGRVVELGLVDSTPGAMFAVVETSGGSGYYVPLWRSEVDAVRQGSLVTLFQQRRNSGVCVGLRVHRLTLEQQITYLGPTWLDRAAPKGSTGFSAAVANAARQRREFLKSEGLDSKGIERQERERVASYHAQRLGRVVAARADGFQGVVESVYEAHGGRRYVILVNDGKVLAVRASPQVRNLVHRRVRVTVGRSEHDGRFRIDVAVVRHT